MSSKVRYSHFVVCLISPISFVIVERSHQNFCFLHLCAWGNDAISEVDLRRINYWLKLFLIPLGCLQMCLRIFARFTMGSDFVPKINLDQLLYHIVYITKL